MAVTSWTRSARQPVRPRGDAAMRTVRTASALAIALIGSACLASSAVKELPLSTILNQRFALQGQTFRVCGQFMKQNVSWVLWTPEPTPSHFSWSVRVRGCVQQPPVLDDKGCLLGVLNRVDNLTAAQALAQKRTFALVHGSDGSYVLDQVCPRPVGK